MKSVISSTIVAIVLFLGQASSPAFASCEIKFSNLPDSVVKEMEAACSKKEEELAQAAKASATKVTSVEEMSKYAEVATQVAGALGVAARELGMAANDFLQTPAGALVAAIIVFKVLGPTLVAFLSTGILLLLARKILGSLWNEDTGEVENVEGWWGAKSTRKIYRRITYREQDDNAVFWSFLTILICIVPLVCAAFFR